MQDAVYMFETVIQQFESVSFNYQQMNREEDKKKENTFFTTLAFEDFLIRFAEEQLLNSTFSELSANDSHVGEWKMPHRFYFV